MKALPLVCESSIYVEMHLRLALTSSPEYSFTVPHDMETLIDFMGGQDEFERRLDYIFQPNTS